MSKFLLLLALVAGSAFGADQKISAPSGNLILDAKAGSVVKVNKTLQVDTIKNFAGTSGAPGMVPIGGMVAVMPTTHANAWQPPADCSTIKDGFMRTSTTAGVSCVVPTCADCVIPAGTTLPNMYQKYTRGGGTSGAQSGANTQASEVTISDHSFTQPSAHGITQPTFTSPAHYHGFGSGSGLGGGSHQHKIQETAGGNFMFVANVFNTTGSAGGAGQTANPNQTATLIASDYGSIPDHGHTGYIGLVNGGVNGNAAMGDSRTTDVGLTNNHTGGGVSTHGVTNNAVNNEPAYTEVVWIIRVK